MPKTILVVEDDRHSREGLRDLLERAGHTVETAADGREALGKIRGGPFEVVITDLDLPARQGASMTGWDLVCILRSSHPAIAIIVVSAREDGAVSARAEQLKAAYLGKPISPAELKTIVRALAPHPAPLIRKGLREAGERLTAGPSS